MIGCLWTLVHKQPIIALYFESETELKFYSLEAWSPYFDHEIISTAILFPSADSRRVVVNFKRKFVYKVLVNRLVKLAWEKVWLGELTIPT